MLIFWLAMYVYCLTAVVYLGLMHSLPWFFIMGILFTAGTLYIGISEAGKKGKTKGKQYENNNNKP